MVLKMRKYTPELVKLQVKGEGLSKSSTDYTTMRIEANEKISNAININRIEEGKSIEKARSFVTNE